MASAFGNLTGKNKAVCEKMAAILALNRAGKTSEYPEIIDFIDQIIPGTKAKIEDKYFRDSSYDRSIAMGMTILDWIGRNEDKCGSYQNLLKSLGKTGSFSKKYAPNVHNILSSGSGATGGARRRLTKATRATKRKPRTYRGGNLFACSGKTQGGRRLTRRTRTYVRPKTQRAGYTTRQRFWPAQGSGTMARIPRRRVYRGGNVLAEESFIGGARKRGIVRRTTTRRRYLGGG
ncbi:MAG: hypothetical protein EHM20_05800, partial [Alphaproteobacteria bacterium]